MDFLSNLLPGVPSLELDPTNPLHNVTLLQNTFMSAFLGTFLANLGAQTVRHILGESVNSYSLSFNAMICINLYYYIVYLTHREHV